MNTTALTTDQCSICLDSPPYSECPGRQCQRLAAVLKELEKWERPFDQERFDAAKQQASHADSLAAQGVYIVALEHALKQALKAKEELVDAYVELEKRAEEAQHHRIYKACPKHEGLAWNFRATVAVPMLEVCPHCEALEPGA